MDPDGAAAEFDAVEHDVVGDRADLAEVAGFEQRHVLGFRAGEGMMHRDPVVVFRAEKARSGKSTTQRKLSASRFRR